MGQDLSGANIVGAYVVPGDKKDGESTLGMYHQGERTSQRNQLLRMRKSHLRMMTRTRPSDSLGCFDDVSSKPQTASQPTKEK
jgi:hypothetical protein